MHWIIERLDMNGVWRAVASDMRTRRTVGWTNGDWRHSPGMALSLTDEAFFDFIADRATPIDTDNAVSTNVISTGAAEHIHVASASGQALTLYVFDPLHQKKENDAGVVREDVVDARISEAPTPASFRIFDTAYRQALFQCCDEILPTIRLDVPGDENAYSFVDHSGEETAHDCLRRLANSKTLVSVLRGSRIILAFRDRADMRWGRSS